MGRFIQADTIVPDPADLQSLDRYAYARNNPLNRIDPTGYADELGETGAYWYQLNANAATPADLYLTVDQRIYVEKNARQYTVADWIGTVAIGVGIVAAPEIIEAGYKLIPAAVSLFSKTCTAESIWQLNPLERGRQIHEIFGENLPSNFPVIDRFVNGVATSIKSINLSAPSYQNISALTRKVTGYIDSLANWQGATWGGVRIQLDQITARTLGLAIPSTGWTQEQWNALVDLQDYAAGLGVTLNIIQIP